MRFYELAKKINADKDALLAQVQEAGFEVKNSLVSVGEDVIAWVEKNATPTGTAVADGEADTKADAKAKPSAGSGSKKKSAAKPKASARGAKTAARPKTSTKTKKTEPVADATAAEDESPATADTVEEAADATEAEAKPRKRRKRVKRALKKGESFADLAAEKAAAEEAEQKAQAEAAEAAAASEAASGEEEAGAAPESGTTEAEAPPETETATTEAAAATPSKAKEAETKEEKEEEEKKKGGRRRHRREEEDEEDRKHREGRRKESRSGRTKYHELEPEEEEEVLQEVVEPIVAEEEVEVEGEVLSSEEATKTPSHKHKRADFRSRAQKVELPATFAELDGGYPRSIAGGGGGRRRGGRRGRGRGRRPRTRRVTRSVTRERDPNAVATITPGMTPRELSVALGVKMNDILGYLMRNGHMAQVNDILPEETIELIAEEYKIPYQWKGQEGLEDEVSRILEEREQSAAEGEGVERPPVVTFLGHVDHGKTSLLDRIRQSRVADGEAGGITQHIGAYVVEKNDQEISFLDTPGHEAFTSLRARGADVTDVAVLVVAADDGVMPQTEEAVSHARSAGVPIVVAINKIDLPNANPDRVRQELANRLELLPEEWGGQVGMVEVSAATGDGIEDLLERILLEAEVLELTAHPDHEASGFVIESEVSERLGVVATVLVRDGTLHRGDAVLYSNGYGKIKLMQDENGQAVEEVPPGYPALITGLSAVPEAGDRIYALDDLSKARELAEQRERQARSAALSKRAHVTLENLRDHLGVEDRKELNVILKADVMGSLEVLQKTLGDLATDEVSINVIHQGVGGINQADVILADATDALIVGFHVVADQGARLQASSHGVQIKVYHIIYRLIEDMRAALSGLLPAEEREVVQGHLEVRDLFRSSRIGTIAGCFVTDGVVTRNSSIRLIRDNVVIYTGTLASLRRFTDDVREVRNGFECGVKITNYDDVKVGDTLEAFIVEEVARTL